MERRVERSNIGGREEKEEKRRLKKMEWRRRRWKTGEGESTRRDEVDQDEWRGAMSEEDETKRRLLLMLQ